MTAFSIALHRLKVINVCLLLFLGDVMEVAQIPVILYLRFVLRQEIWNAALQAVGQHSDDAADVK